MFPSKGARYGLRQLQISPLIADPLNGGPGTAQYANAVLLSAAASLDITAEVESDQLKGDDTICALYGLLQGFKGKLSYGIDDLAAEAVILNGILSQQGASPNQVYQLAHSGPQQFGYYMIEGRVVDSVGAPTDYYMQMTKCMTTGQSSTNQNKKWGQSQVDVYCTRRDSDSLIYIRQRRQTGAPLNQAFDNTAPTLLTSTPANGAVGVADNTTTITLNFDRNLMPGSVSLSGFVLMQDSNHAVIPLSQAALNGQTVTLTIGQALLAATSYSLFVAQDIANVSGVQMIAPEIIHFTTT